MSECLDDLLMFIYVNRWNIFLVLAKNCLYQLLLQGLNPVLITSFLLRQLFLSNLFCHLNSLHHLLFCLQVGFFNFCLQSGKNKNDSLF